MIHFVALSLFLISPDPSAGSPQEPLQALERKLHGAWNGSKDPDFEPARTHLSVSPENADTLRPAKTIAVKLANCDRLRL